MSVQYEGAKLNFCLLKRNTKNCIVKSTVILAAPELRYLRVQIVIRRPGGWRVTLQFSSCMLQDVREEGGIGEP